MIYLRSTDTFVLNLNVISYSFSLTTFSLSSIVAFFSTPSLAGFWKETSLSERALLSCIILGILHHRLNEDCRVAGGCFWMVY